MRISPTLYILYLFVFLLVACNRRELTYSPEATITISADWSQSAPAPPSRSSPLPRRRLPPTCLKMATVLTGPESGQKEKTAEAVLKI